jgi:O-succinylbenzoic acid--CoA ligase
MDASLMTRHEAHCGDRVVRCFVERQADIYGVFERTAARRPEAEALVAGDLRLSYRDLHTDIERVAAALHRAGLGAGERVGVVLGNRPEFVIATLAALRLGAVAVPIGTRLAAAEIRYILEHCGARMVIHEDEAAGAAAAVQELAGTVTVVRCGSAYEPGSFGDLILDGPPAPARVVPAEKDIAFLLYTSGTTGRPKGAMLTHLNVWHSLRHFELGHRLGANERSLLAVPATHVTGLVAIILSMVNVGGAILLLPVFKARGFLEFAARERMTHTVLVPAMYNLLLREPERTAFDLSAWRLGSYGGAPMPEAAIVALGAWLPDLSLVNGYGATETSSPTSLTPIGEGLARRETVGKPVHCAEVIVVDDQGCEVPPGATGEIWIRGPMVVPGYWRDPEATRASFTAGFWHSGDVGSIDSEGYLRLIDRKKDVINRGGYKIYSVEVENVLASFPGVFECAVVAKPCPVLGERVHAYVSRVGPEVSAESMTRFCADRLADYKVPESFTLMDGPLPRSSAGKLLKRLLRDLARDAGT